MLTSTFIIPTNYTILPKYPSMVKSGAFCQLWMTHLCCFSHFMKKMWDFSVLHMWTNLLFRDKQIKKILNDALHENNVKPDTEQESFYWLQPTVNEPRPTWKACNVRKTLAIFKMKHLLNWSHFDLLNYPHRNILEKQNLTKHGEI